MRQIGIDELSSYSPWVERLLGVAPFQKLERNIAKIDAEYDKDKYAKLRQFYKQNPGIDIDELKRVADGNLLPDEEVCISRGDELFLVSAAEAQWLARQTIVDSLQPYMAKSPVVIELGCGYGYNLGVLREIAPNCSFIGADYSSNAVALASELFKGYPEIIFTTFNFYDEDWPFFDDFDGKALVFTNHAIEQMPSAKSVMEAFLKYRQKIAGVIHLEPAFEFNDADSKLGLMRRGYTLMNDYNRDLFTVIREAGAKILKTEKDVFGHNPLNPTSIIAWQF